MFVNERVKQSAVYDTKNGPACANADSESKNSDESEAGAAAEHARAVANDLPELLQPHETPHLARFFFHPRHITEFADSCIAGFFRRHAALDVVLRFSLDVLANFIVELLQHALSAEHDWPPSPRAGECG